MTKDIEDLLTPTFSREDLLNAVPQMIKFYNHLIPILGNPEVWNHKYSDRLNREFFQRPLRKNHNKTTFIKIYRYCLKEGLLEMNSEFMDYIKAKAGRSNAGITNVTLLMGPGAFSCKWDCHYCPNDTTTWVPEMHSTKDRLRDIKYGAPPVSDMKGQFGVARSYRIGEPAVDRGAKNGWDPVLQFTDRCDGLHNNGHNLNKLEVIISGGTFNSYPQKYSEDFIRDVYYAANTYYSESRLPLSLEEEITLNETAISGVIGLTLETRPDAVGKKDIREFRRLGVTRIQMGIQTIFDTISKGVNRQCTFKACELAAARLVCNGFKIDGHFMPDLPGSNKDVDLLMAKWIFKQPLGAVSNETLEIIGVQGFKLVQTTNESMMFDQHKWYPTMVIPDSKLHDWHIKGKDFEETDIEKGIYVSYAERFPKKMDEVVEFVMTHCPITTRINRLMRDFSDKEICGGDNRLGLRDEIGKKIAAKGLRQTDIRGREIRGRFMDFPNTELKINSYTMAGGSEFFIYLWDAKKERIYGFCRLRFNGTSTPNKHVAFKCLMQDESNNYRVAMVRELHVYGSVASTNKKEVKGRKTQHTGAGKFLMFIAEGIAKKNGYNHMAVISGVGVRGYYAKLGYNLVETYMVKKLTDPITLPSMWVDKVPKSLKPKLTFDWRLVSLLIIPLILLIF